MKIDLIGKHEKDPRACRDAMALTLNEMMAADQSICYVDCDLMGCVNTRQLQKNYPERTFQAGIAKETGAIITAENHNVTCGLGSVVANCLTGNCPAVQEFVGVQDQFGQVGPQDYLMDVYGLRAANIVEAVKRALARK